MATVRITEAEFARDPRAYLAQVREGAELVIEDAYRTVAFVQPPRHSGRRASEILREARVRGLTEPGEAFARDVAAIVAERSTSWNENSPE